MRRFLLPLLAAALLTACGGETTVATTTTDSPAPEAPKKLEFRSSNDRPVSLGAHDSPSQSLPTYSDDMSPAPAPSSDLTNVPALSLASNDSTKKSKPYEGAVVEDLGPCQGRGVAGEIRVHGDTSKAPVCGQDPQSYRYSSSYSRYGSSSRSSSRSPYGSSRYPSRP